MTTNIKSLATEINLIQKKINMLTEENTDKYTHLCNLISEEFSNEINFLKACILKSFPDAKLKPITFGFSVKSKEFGNYVSNIKNAIDSNSDHRICTVKDIDWYSNGFHIKEAEITLTKTYMRLSNKELVNFIR